jgi:hypothetical protein
MLQIRAVDLSVGEKLRHYRPHSEVHIELPLRFFQGKAAPAQERQQCVLI